MILTDIVGQCVDPFLKADVTGPALTCRGGSSLVQGTQSIGHSCYGLVAAAGISPKEAV